MVRVDGANAAADATMVEIKVNFIILLLLSRLSFDWMLFFYEGVNEYLRMGKRR